MANGRSSPEAMTRVLHGSASNLLARAPVSARRSIRICDSLDSLVALTQVVASLTVLVHCSGGSLDRHKDSLGPDPRRIRDCARDDVGSDAMDGVAARLPAAARASLVRSCGNALLCAAGLFLVVVPLRRLCTAHICRGCGARSLRRFCFDWHCDRHVGLAGTRSQDHHDLWLGALGDQK